MTTDEEVSLNEGQCFFAQLLTGFVSVFLLLKEVNTPQVNLLFSCVEHFTHFSDRKEVVQNLTLNMDSLQRSLNSQTIFDIFKYARDGLSIEAREELAIQVSLMGSLGVTSSAQKANFLGFFECLVGALDLDKSKVQRYYDAGDMQVTEYKIMLPGHGFEEETRRLNSALLRSNFDFS